jgi:hypothetical protein
MHVLIDELIINNKSEGIISLWISNSRYAVQQKSMQSNLSWADGIVSDIHYIKHGLQWFDTAQKVDLK